MRTNNSRNNNKTNDPVVPRVGHASYPRSTNLHPTQLIPEDLRRPEVPDTFRKKPVALLVGYVGSRFSGNTSNPVLPRGATVDDVLEDAAFAAGGVLLSNYRSRALSRLK